VQIVSQIITVVVTILLALNGWRYWALVGGSLTTAAITTALTFFFCPWVPGRMRKGTGVRDMLKFGGHLTGFNFINYFSRNADNILIGRYIGADALGLYAKAYQLFMMPISQIRGPLTQVAMPVLCSLKDQPERYVKYYQRLLDILATLTIPLTIYCAIEADFLIRLLLGSQWVAAVSVFRILAIAGLFQAIASTRGLVLISYGFSRRYFYYGAFNAVLCVVSFIVGIPYGIEGVAASYTIANYLFLVPALFYCFSKTPVTVSLFFKTLFLPLLTGTLAGGGVLLFKHVWPSELFIIHGLSLVLFGLLYIGLSFCRQSIRETWNMFLKGVLSGLTKKAVEI
ncbi:MAG: oligosaccharide flippase family protein, partial [Chloroflexi bacterium]|nr:oligosaccharide flippase family protein [Chloroflexota bacterium]